MRRFLWLGVFASCTVSPEAPPSSATFSASDTVHASRATAGFVSYGAPYHRWLITLATIDGCDGDSQAELEITTVSGVTELPIGTIPMRTAEMPATVPSAYVRYMGAPVASGSVTIEAASATFVSGSWTAQVALGGIPTDLTGTFGAPVCASP